jgi:hypothetical protein
MDKYTKGMRRTGKNFIIGGTMGVLAFAGIANMVSAQTNDTSTTNQSMTTSVAREKKSTKKTHKKVTLTDAQKQAIKDAKSQAKAGDTEKAKATLAAAGLPEKGFTKRMDNGKKLGIKKMEIKKVRANTTTSNSETVKQ